MPGIFIAIDFEKAFDTLDFKFNLVSALLSYTGFEYFIKMCMPSTVMNYGFIWNGKDKVKRHAYMLYYLILKMVD